MDLTIEHDETNRQFRTVLPSGPAHVSYAHRGDDVLDLQSTFVPPSERGQGVGRKLVLHVLDYAREHGLRIIPSCPFIPPIVADHPEYQSLIAR